MKKLGIVFLFIGVALNCYVVQGQQNREAPPDDEIIRIASLGYFERIESPIIFELHQQASPVARDLLAISADIDDILYNEVCRYQAPFCVSWMWAFDPRHALSPTHLMESWTEHEIVMWSINSYENRRKLGTPKMVTAYIEHAHTELDVSYNHRRLIELTREKDRLIQEFEESQEL